MAGRGKAAAAAPQQWVAGLLVDDQPVLEVAPASGPGGIPNLGLLALTVQADGGPVVIYGCVDDMQGPWAKKMDGHRHRVDVHGDEPGKLLTAAARPLQMPATLAGMTLREFVDLAAAMGQWEGQIEALTGERDRWKTEAIELRDKVRALEASARRTAKALQALGVKLAGDA